ncbi:HTH-type transcriptional regulator [Desulfamplus magnetovallimortis]|uniref:HTH-type transcriptional regulator n=1 Tax=Desulfamplus magnetovallimortis TaxID=1246637 RepID=A0A1W1HB57_9BACT|nr:GntR family transcriptional regulator [Desulfamplus magnetovallimortis]SLM29717.1 HTH-type transcriptional regulator [Desulfamplus magnetovallimortis]
MKNTIYKTIRERILYLEYKPGQILNEKVLAEEFKVSRSPIKEVLSRLEWDQFIRVIPRTGSMVTEIEFSRIMNVYQVRFEIESFETNLAKEKLSSAHGNQLKTLYKDCESLLDNKDPKALTQIDIALRNILHDAAGNPVLADLSDGLYSQTFRVWFSVLAQSEYRDEVLAVLTELKKIMECIISGDKNELVTIRRNQLLNHFERLRSKFLGTIGASTGQFF